MTYEQVIDTLEEWWWSYYLIPDGRRTSVERSLFAAWQQERAKHLPVDNDDA